MPSSRFSFAWRDRVADPNWLRWCTCRHAEQVHFQDEGACTAGSVAWPCLCGKFTESRREWVGFGEAP